MSLFSRRRDQPEDPQAVVDQLASAGQATANQAGQATANQPGPVTAGGQPGYAPPIGGSTAGFQLTVEDVFVIKGRGIVATGTISAGRVSNGMPVVVYRAMQPIGVLSLKGVEMFRKQVDSAVAGQNVGLLFSSTDRSAVQRGDLLADR